MASDERQTGPASGITSPYENLAIKLWDDLGKAGLGAVFAPWQIKRLARAEAEAKHSTALIHAQAEKDVEDIRSGRMRLVRHSTLLEPTERNDKNQNRPIPDRIEPTIDPAQWLTAVETERLTSDARKTLNVAKAIVRAQESLEDVAAQPSQEPIDIDWLLRWRDYAGDVSSERLQELWGRVLGGESVNPGSFSLRTLEVIRSLSSSEAEIIEKISPFVAHGASWMWCTAKRDLKEFGLAVVEVSELQGLGIIAPSLSSVLVISETQEMVAYDYHDKGLIGYRKRNDKKMELPVWIVNPIGVQLLSLCKPKSNRDYMRALSKHFSDNGHDVMWGDMRQVGGKRLITNETMVFQDGGEVLEFVSELP